MLGADIRIWGPAGWEFMHACSFAYDIRPSNTARKQFYTFFKSIGYVLPCAECRNHYTKIFNSLTPHKEYSEIFDSQDTLARAIVHIHNQVNYRNNKPILKYECIRSAFKDAHSVVVKSQRRSLCYVFYVFILALVMAFCLRYTMHRRIRNITSQYR